MLSGQHWKYIITGTAEKQKPQDKSNSKDGGQWQNTNIGGFGSQSTY